MEKIASLFGGHKKEGEDVQARPQCADYYGGGQGQATKHEDGEKKGLFGFGGHKEEDQHKGKEEKTGIFGHKKKNKEGGNSSSSSSSDSESEEGKERQKRRKERKEKKRHGHSEV